MGDGIRETEERVERRERNETVNVGAHSRAPSVSFLASA